MSTPIPLVPTFPSRQAKEHSKQTSKGALKPETIESYRNIFSPAHSNPRKVDKCSVFRIILHPLHKGSVFLATPYRFPPREVKATRQIFSFPNPQATTNYKETGFPPANLTQIYNIAMTDQVAARINRLVFDCIFCLTKIIRPQFSHQNEPKACNNI